jgi:YggT family protein
MSALLVLPLALTRDNVAHYVNTLLDVYIVLIFIRILMSWIPRIPYYRWLDALLGFVREVTDPFLNLFRRFIPALRLGGGALDLSPMVAVFVLIIVGGIVVRLIQG